MSSLFDALSPHWEAHQSNQEKHSLAVEIRVQRIQKVVDAFAGIDESGLKDSLLHFLNCAVAASLEKNVDKDAVEAVVELTAAVAVTDTAICEAVLQRAITLTEAHVDSARAMACSTIGFIIQFILNQDNVADFNNLLDAASLSLLPRFTDKSQVVRQEAILASGKLFVDDTAEPELLQAMLWSSQHDTSVANRVAAIESLPLTLETVGFMIQRVRDVKQKVRVAALHALTHKCTDISLFEPTHFCAIIEAGNTDRCDATKKATEELVCLGWMKLVKYDPLELLRRMNVQDNESVCAHVVAMLQRAADSTDFLEALSDPEIRAFRESMQKSVTAFSDVENELNSEKLFLSIASIKNAPSDREKNSILSKILPDASSLCKVLEDATGSLIEAIQAQDEELESEYVSVCSQLIQLIALADLEEGSRRLFLVAIRRLLTSILAPDDLIDEAVKTLKSLSRDDNVFVEEVREIVKDINVDANNKEDLFLNYKLRATSILNTFFELIDQKQAGNPIMTDLSEDVLPLVEHSNALLREAAVSCVGKIGLFSTKNRIVDHLEPLLLEILLNDDEKDAIRGQAMLGLADWSLLDQMNPKFADYLSEALTTPNFPKAMVCIATEIAAKLLLAGKANQLDWIAALIVMVFNPTDEETNDEATEEDDSKEVGSLTRLQQVLTLFFPAYCLTYKDAGSTFINAIPSVLDSILEIQANSKKPRGYKGKKAPKASLWPFGKMLDYIVSTCEQVDDSGTSTNIEEEEKQNLHDSDDSGSKAESRERETNTKSSPLLLTAIEVAAFLESNAEIMSSTSRRALCKWLGGIYLPFELQFIEDLSRLKQSLDEVQMSIADASSSRHLSPLLELLEDIPGEEQASDDEEDDDDGQDHMDEEDSESLTADVVEDAESSDPDHAHEKENETELEVGPVGTEKVRKTRRRRRSLQEVTQEVG